MKIAIGELLGVVLISAGVAGVAAADSFWHRVTVYVAMLAIYGAGRFHERLHRGA